MSNTSMIMSLKDLINMAFGSGHVNYVNFKMIQTILYLLANQLRILGRHVQLDFEAPQDPSHLPDTTLSVTEVKLRATAPAKDNNKTQSRKTKAAPSTSATAREPVKSASEKSLTDTSGTVTSKSQYTTASTITSTSEDATATVSTSSGKKTTTSSQSATTEATGTSDETTNGVASSSSATNKTSSSTKAETKTTSNQETSKAETAKTKTGSLTTVDNEARIAPTTKKEDHYHLLEEIKEKELRVISQRGDSREEPKNNPSPMTSIEKLLVVERVPIDDVNKQVSPKISVVTKEEFYTLVESVHELMQRFNQTPALQFPENAELMNQLRKGASLTDAMAALQLSARLEAAEKTLHNMMSLVTDLAIQTDVDVSKIVVSCKKPETQIIYGKDSTKASEIAMKQSESAAESGILGIKSDTRAFSTVSLPRDCVTHEELKETLQDFHNNIMEKFLSINNASSQNATNAINVAKRLEEQLQIIDHLDERMEHVEEVITAYAEQVNKIDTELSSQMTDYQEQLTLMQHNLESGLENLNEAFANVGSDTTAILELSTNFTTLQAEFEHALLKQMALREAQNRFSTDIQGLWEEIELLRDIKADRDEVVDALRDKAGIAELNGLVNRSHFDAVQGDFEKRILQCFTRFNSQEKNWQKAIDDVVKHISEKADFLQLVYLREDINQHINLMKQKLEVMSEIVGTPKAASIRRELFRDAKCISCSNPAAMNVEEPPPLERHTKLTGPIDGAEAQPKESGDGICYTGKRVLHQRDPRAHVCRRYCGGSHTMIPTGLNRVPPDCKITNFDRIVCTVVGSDGKAYLADDMERPCIPCNAPKQKLSTAKKASNPDSDFGLAMDHHQPRASDISMTPSDYQFNYHEDGSTAAIERLGSMQNDATPDYNSDVDGLYID